MGDTSFLALPDLVDKQFSAAGFLGSNTLEVVRTCRLLLNLLPRSSLN